MANFENVKQFPVKCNICKRDLSGGMLYFKHPKHGFVGECCPQFEEGGISVQNSDEEE